MPRVPRLPFGIPFQSRIGGTIRFEADQCDQHGFRQPIAGERLRLLYLGLPLSYSSVGEDSVWY